MRQVWITEPGGPEVLRVREAPDPRPGPGDVLIRVEAAGINFADLMARQGLYPGAPDLPTVVGYEVAGTVEAVGEGVERFQPGANVLAIMRFGGYSTHVAVPQVQVFERPEGMPAEIGAALPVNYLTAFQAMVVMGGLRHAQDLGGSRMRVLVHGASGGVGTAAGDIGRIYGAELFGTASPQSWTTSASGATITRFPIATTTGLRRFESVPTGAAWTSSLTPSAARTGPRASA